MSIEGTAAVDAAIAQVAAENRASFELLMELENHAGHALLRAGTAAGGTRARWEAAQADLATLWELHLRHAKTLDALRGLRGRRSRLGVDDLLLVGRLLDGADVPQPPRSTDDVAAAMAEIGARVVDVLHGVGEAWAALGAAIDRCTLHLAVADGRLADLGAPRPHTLHARLDALRATALDDPLAYWTGAAVDTSDLDALEVECAGAAEAAAELVALRAAADDVFAEADAAAARLERREWEAVLRRAQAAVAVGRAAAVVVAAGMGPAAGVGAGSIPAGMSAADVRAAAGRARACAADGDWVAFGAAVADLRATEAAAAARSDALLSAVERPLRTRAELRGLLDLYRVKAVGTGRGEDVALDRLHRAAHDLLWSAPTDLTAAAAAVDAYRHAVLATREDTP